MCSGRGSRNCRERQGVCWRSSPSLPVRSRNRSPSGPPESRPRGGRPWPSWRASRHVRSTGSADKLPRSRPITTGSAKQLVAHLPSAALAGARTTVNLARVLIAAGGADPELLAVHCLGAGEPEPAGNYFLAAAEQAAQTLAFNRAAEACSGSLWSFGDEGGRKAGRGPSAESSAMPWPTAGGAWRRPGSTRPPRSVRARPTGWSSSGSRPFSTASAATQVDEGKAVFRDVLARVAHVASPARAGGR